MIGNLKKAALNSLDGKWGVGIGVSALFYFVPTLSASAIAFFYVFNICTVYRDNWP